MSAKELREIYDENLTNEEVIKFIYNLVKDSDNEDYIILRQVIEGRLCIL